MKRYKELKFNDKIITETSEIDKILIENKFNWFLDCEVENTRIEIFKNHLIFNSGVFFNGTWVYGVFRNGQWKSGTWQGGVWYNGTWYHGVYENGLIFNGRFLGGAIKGGEIRGGEFHDVEISRNVIRTDMIVQSPEEEIQKVVPQKIVERLNHIKSYNFYLKESSDEDNWWEAGNDPFGESDKPIEKEIILNITDRNYKDYFQAKKPVILEFWAEWCGPCRMLKPIMEELASMYRNDAVFGRVDVDTNPQICNDLNIKNIPTTIFIKNGVEVDRQVGAVPLNVLIKKFLWVLG